VHGSVLKNLTKLNKTQPIKPSKVKRLKADGQSTTMPPSSGSSASLHLQSKSSSKSGPRRSNGPPIPPSQLSTRVASGKRDRSPAPQRNKATPALPPAVGLPETSFARPAEALEKVAARTLGIPVASVRAKGLARKLASSLAETMTPHAPEPPLVPRVSVASQIAELPGKPVNYSRV
jgi:hypothetical protein